MSYRHALQVVRVHGESGALALAYPLTIDGLIYAASMVLLNAARRGMPRPTLAYAALTLGIAATLAANVAAGVAFGPVGAIVAAWPAPALVISYELLMIVIRSSVTVPDPTTPEAVPEPVPGTVPADSLAAAEASYAATVAAGNPLSQNQLIERFGLTRAQSVKVRQASLAQANGHEIATGNEAPPGA